MHQPTAFTRFFEYENDQSASNRWEQKSPLCVKEVESHTNTLTRSQTNSFTYSVYKAYTATGKSRSSCAFELIEGSDTKITTDLGQILGNYHHHYHRCASLKRFGIE